MTAPTHPWLGGGIRGDDNEGTLKAAPRQTLSCGCIEVSIGYWVSEVRVATV
jgi:hypothetical protein